MSCIGLIVPSAMTTIKIDHVNQNDVSYREVISLGKAVCGIVIVGGVMGVALETAAIILRFVNIGFINMKIKYFLFAVSDYVIITRGWGGIPGMSPLSQRMDTFPLLPCVANVIRQFY